MSSPRTSVGRRPIKSVSGGPKARHKLGLHIPQTVMTANTCRLNMLKLKSCIEYRTGAYPPVHLWCYKLQASDLSRGLCARALLVDISLHNLGFTRGAPWSSCATRAREVSGKRLKSLYSFSLIHHFTHSRSNDKQRNQPALAHTVISPIALQ